MDPRFHRPLSPGSRRYGHTGRSSTGNLELRDYESYYSNPRSSRDSITSGARLSSERLAPRSTATRVYRESQPSRRNPDDYPVAPRRTLEPDLQSLSRRPLNIITSSSSNRYPPVISSAVEKPSSPYAKVRPRDDDTAYVLPASSDRHHRHYSAGSSAYLGVNKERERERGEKGGYRSSGPGKNYYNNPPPVRQPKDPYDSDYGYEYTNRTEQAYRDTEPRPRVRRGSDTGTRERPHSITGLEDYYTRQPVGSRDAGPPVSMRGFSKLDQNNNTRHEYRYPRESTQHRRDSSLTRANRDDDEGLSRRRSNRAPVSLHQDPNDDYSSNVEERSRHKHRHASRRTESMERDNERGLGIRYQEDEARRTDEKPRRHHDKGRAESEDRYGSYRHRREDSEERVRNRESRRHDHEDSERERNYHAERDERDRRHRHTEDKEHKHRHDVDDRDRRHNESRKERHESSKLGEGLALGAAGAAAAAGLVTEKSRHRRDKDQSDLDSELSPREKHHRRGHDRQAISRDPNESSSRSEDSDEERRKRHRRRRKDREEREAKEGRSRTAESALPAAEIHSGSHASDLNPSNQSRNDDKESKSHRHRGRDHDSDLTPDSEGSVIERAPRDEKTASRVRVLSPAKTEEPKPKGILRQPREKFPEDPAPIREGVAPLKDAGKKGIPPNARWTKIDRRLVNPAALEAGNERYEQRVDYVIVLRVLTREEIEKYATLTHEIREERTREAKRAHILALEDVEHRYDDDEKEPPKRLESQAYNHSENEHPDSRARNTQSHNKYSEPQSLQVPSSSANLSVSTLPSNTSSGIGNDPNRPDIYPAQSYQRERPSQPSSVVLPPQVNQPGTYPPPPNNFPVPGAGATGPYTPSPAHSTGVEGGPYAAPPLPPQGQPPTGGFYQQQQPVKMQQQPEMQRLENPYPSLSGGYQGGSTGSLPIHPGRAQE